MESVGEAEYVSFPVPTNETTNLTVRVKAIAKATVGDEVTFHYTVTDVFLVKEDGQWKVDDWNITCGFVTDKEVGKGEEVKVLYTENLEGCEWQPPSGGAW